LHRSAAQEASEEQRRATVQRIGQNIGAALDALREASPDADIAVMTYYDPIGGDPAIVGSEAFWVKQLNDEIRAQATSRNAAVADVYTAFSGGRAYEYTNVLVGDIHANARGHTLIAEQYWRALGY
jgi:lysophospholipase L1-like esterase